MDILPTVLDILHLDSYQGRALDGISLLPYLRGEMAERPQSAGIGIHGSFRFGSTNHKVGADGKESYPDICPTHSDAIDLGDVPFDFATVGNLPQFSWAEGNDLKLFGCRGHCNGTNCNSTDGAGLVVMSDGSVKVFFSITIHEIYQFIYFFRFSSSIFVDFS